MSEETTMVIQFRAPALRGRHRFVAAFGALAAASVLFLLALGGDAQARVPIHGFDVTTTSTQAGGHPDIATRVEVGTFATEGVDPCFCNAVRDIIVKSPPGIVGVPGNIAQCDATELASLECPTDSQVGVVAVRLFAPLEIGGAYFIQPLYNMEPRPGQLALLATLAPIAATPIYTVASARTESDYGLEFKTFGLPRLVPPNEITQFTWGVPAEHRHDDLRWQTEGTEKSAACFDGNPLAALVEDRFPNEMCGGGTPGEHAAIAPPTPFLLNPTNCEGPLTATLETVGYEFSTEHREQTFPATTGCDQLAFDPSLSAEPTTNEADTPSGLNVDLKVPQFLSPSASSPSEIRGTKITLPPGLTIDPNVADGKVTCSDEQAGFGTREQARCPEFSKIGSLTLDSSALPGPLPGSIYLGEPRPGDRSPLPLLHESPADAVPGVRPAPVRRREGASRDSDAVREISGGKRIRTVGQRSSESDFGSVLHHRQRPRRRTVPSGGPSIQPGDRRGSDQQLEWRSHDLRVQPDSQGR
jgi:hypothetical protein